MWKNSNQWNFKFTSFINDWVYFINRVRRALVRSSTKPERIEAAYEAPFYGNIKSKAGARRFPWCIPFAEPEAGSAARQADAFEKLKKRKRPIHFIFGGNDPIFPPSWGREWSTLVPNSSFDVIENAGHFCQEDAGEEIVSRFLELCKKRPCSFNFNFHRRTGSGSTNDSQSET